MSHPLHNKIYLGRHAGFGTRLVKRVTLIAAIVGVAAACLLVGS